MGNCLSNNSDPEATKANNAVEKDLKAVRICSIPEQRAKAVLTNFSAREEETNSDQGLIIGLRRLREVNSAQGVLILGSHLRRKFSLSTIQQMRVIHNDKFTPQEIESYRQLVFNNIIRGAVMLFDALPMMQLRLSQDNERFAETLRNINDLRDGEVYPEGLLQPLLDLWADAAAQEGWSRANEVALPENLHYFFGDLPRVFERDYVPITQDIIRCRAQTTGITETVFKLRGQELHLIDVGGQRSERRKWIHCFQDVTTILFLVSLNGYDQCLFEDSNANRMQDAMAIWTSICESIYFKSTNIVSFPSYLSHSAITHGWLSLL
ncbi:unnamed protein product [Rhizoctonia solani]|uniref:Guanine nucleotide-binding protein alpha-2 subunit n=1 Tax=Rhizoctonia solani TaxID=456999 RepID=A0A8H3DRQ4_9AGAM|nr:unnamed protein product [Rhizoctonia solani]